MFLKILGQLFIEYVSMSVIKMYTQLYYAQSYKFNSDT